MQSIITKFIQLPEQWNVSILQHSQWLASDRTADTNSLQRLQLPTVEDSVHLKETAVSIHKNVVCLGVILLVCGVASQLGGALALKVYAAFAEIAFGLWGGVLVSLNEKALTLTALFTFRVCIAFPLSLISFQSWRVIITVAATVEVVKCM